MNSLLPPNASVGEHAIEATTARLADVPAPLRDLWNPHTCPESLLPWLAWALSLDAWKSYWPIEIKRARVAAALDIQRRKGTRQSVRDVVASFGGAAVITEWWQQSPAGVPHTFAIDVTLSGQNGAEATAEYADDVIAEVTRTMPVRCHLTYNLRSAIAGRLGVAAVARPVLLARLPLIAEAA